ncbi:hypothetical protein OHA02_25645 [Streptomyces phaeochromogenes]|nr:hypothetical protein [Streptomyces phaeochromogenes]
MLPDGTSRQKEKRNSKPRWGVVLAAVSATANVFRLLRELVIHH